MKKKLSKISVLLVLMLTLAVCFAFGASAETDVYECGANGANVIGTYDYETQILTISGEGDMMDYGGENGYGPFSLWQGETYKIKSIIIEDGITRIGDYCFWTTNGTESITIPDSVTSIGDLAFGGMEVESINIPDNVTSIGVQAFGGCNNLKSIIIPDKVELIDRWTFSDCNALESVTLGDQVAALNEFAFYNCASLKTVVLSDSLKEIENYVFKNCTSLESIIIPETVEYIGADVFYNCTNLKSVVLPENTTLYSGFYNCTSLESIVLPKNQGYIGDSWFYNCTSLKSIEFPDKYITIGKGGFENCISLKRITLPNELLAIYENAFVGSGLQEIHFKGTEEEWSNKNIETSPEIDAATIHFIPNDINSLTCLSSGFVTAETCELCAKWATGIDFESRHNYEYTFNWEEKTKVKTCTYCGKAVTEDIQNEDYFTYTVNSDEETITINSVNEYIGSEVVIPATIDGYQVISVSSAFTDNKVITKVTIPADIILGWNTFVGCDNLKTVIFEEGRTEIQSNALSYCESIETVEIPESVKVIGNFAFSGCGNLKSIELPNGLTTIGVDAFNNCGSLENIVIPDTVTEIGSGAFGWCKKITEIELPSGLKRIEASTFSGTSLTSIVIPDSVEYIGDYAFYGNGSKLESVVLPKNLKSIGEWAFSSALFTEVVIPDSVTYMGYAAFGNCENLEKVNIPKGLTELSTYVFGYCNIKEIVIPDNITIIGDDAFLGNEFEAVTIPESVTTIGDQAFCNCEKLKSIYIPDTVESIGIGVFSGCYALEGITVDENNQYYCNDEDGILYTKDKTVLLAYPFKLEKETFVVPSTVKTIETWAIENQHLKNIVLPDGLVTIGENAISGCFESIALPGSLENIDYDPVGSLYLNKVIIGDGIVTLPSSLNGSQLFPMDYVIEGMDLDFTDVEPQYLFMADYKIVGVTQKEFTEYYASLFADGDVTDEEEAAFEQYMTEHIEFYDEYIPVSTIYCHEGSTAEAYAIENGLNYELIHIYGKNEWVNEWDNLVRTRKCNHCDEVETESMETTADNGVEIVEPVDPETTFVVETVEDEASEDYILVTEALEAVEGPAEIEKIYDITLHNSDNVAIQPDGSVQVKLPVENTHENYKVFRVNEDGTYTDMNATVVDGYVVFVTDHFSLYVIVDTTEAHEHSYTEEITKPATHMEEGEKTFTCSACGDSYTEVIEKDPKHYAELKYKSATCTEDGYERAVCECGFVMVDKVYEKLGHFYNYTVTLHPTHTREGSEIADCIRCDDTFINTIDKLPDHYYGYFVKTYDPTCTEGGYTVHQCSCGDSYTDSYTSALGHTRSKNGDWCSVCGVDMEPEKKDCDHMCHQKGFMGFIWSIVQFFWKLFKMNPVCECGAAHY